jgi:hypothetical protein
MVAAMRDGTGIRAITRAFSAPILFFGLFFHGSASAQSAPKAPSVLDLLPPPQAHPLGWEASRPWVVPPEGISFGGYVQTQYESHQDSHDQLFQGGVLQNQDRFVLRRGRVSAVGEWQYVALALEIDGNTVLGPQVDVRKAEATLQYRPNRKKPAIVSATLGQFDTPFGYELIEVPRTRWFMEPSLTARSLWPGTSDLGLRLAGALGFFRWTIAVMNGHPLDEVSPYVLQDPIAAKDVVFHFGVDLNPRDDLHIAGGISSERGRGFHSGTDATKTMLQFRDNGSGASNPGFLAVAGQTGTASASFERYAMGADVRVHFRSRLGVTKVSSELYLAQNMDRGLFIADPIGTGVTQRELGYYVAVVQDIGRYGVVGFRFDTYDPNSDVFDARQSRTFPFNQAITTYAPLVGVMLDRARLVFEYDFIKNALGRDATGVPTTLKMDTWTLRLQVEL